MDFTSVCFDCLDNIQLWPNQLILQHLFLHSRTSFPLALILLKLFFLSFHFFPSSAVDYSNPRQLHCKTMQGKIMFRTYKGSGHVLFFLAKCRVLGTPSWGKRRSKKDLLRIPDKGMCRALWPDALRSSRNLILSTMRNVKYHINLQRLQTNVWAELNLHMRSDVISGG